MVVLCPASMITYIMTNYCSAWFYWPVIIKRDVTSKKMPMAFAYSKCSDQPAQSCRLIRAFTVRTHCVLTLLNYQAQHRYKLDCIVSQAVMGLLYWSIHQVTFLCVISSKTYLYGGDIGITLYYTLQWFSLIFYLLPLAFRLPVKYSYFS